MWNSFQSRGPGMTPRFGFDWHTYTPLYNGQTPEQLSGSGVSGSIPQKMDPVSIGLAVGVPLVTSLINNSFQSSANKRNAALYRQYMDMQRELQRDAQNYNSMMWRMTNQWNSPSNQMALLRAAGLNPNLMYGGAFQGNASAQSSPSQSMSEPGSIYNPLSMSLGNPAETYMAERQLSMQEQSTDLLNEEQRLKNKQLRFDVEHQEEKYNLDTKQQNVSIAETIARTNNLIQDLENLKEQKGILSEQKKQSIIKTFVDEQTKNDFIRSIKAKADLDEKQLVYVDKLMDEISSRIRLNNAQSRHYNALAEGQEKFNKWYLEDYWQSIIDVNDWQASKLYNEIQWDAVLKPIYQRFMETEIKGMTKQQKLMVWQMILGSFNSASQGVGAAGIMMKAVK